MLYRLLVIFLLGLSVTVRYALGMSFRTCDFCLGEFILARSDARFCSTKCRVYFSRTGVVPKVLTSRARWIRFSESKVPLRVSGGNASSTDSSSWSSYGVAVKSRVGVGVGFVLNGDGIACYDLDHCFVDGSPTVEAVEFVRSVNPFYVEVSPSGDGLHAWVFAERSKGFRRRIGGLNVEFYSDARYLTVTGRSIRL